MDETFKQELQRFFKKNWEFKMGDTDSFIIEFEEWLKEEGFDLSSVLQYKND